MCRPVTCTAGRLRAGWPIGRRACRRAERHAADPRAMSPTRERHRGFRYSSVCAMQFAPGANCMPHGNPPRAWVARFNPALGAARTRRPAQPSLVPYLIGIPARPAPPCRPRLCPHPALTCTRIPPSPAPSARPRLHPQPCLACTLSPGLPTLRRRRGLPPTHRGADAAWSGTLAAAGARPRRHLEAAQTAPGSVRGRQRAEGFRWRGGGLGEQVSNRAVYNSYRSSSLQCRLIKLTCVAVTCVDPFKLTFVDRCGCLS